MQIIVSVVNDYFPTFPDPLPVELKIRAIKMPFMSLIKRKAGKIALVDHASNTAAFLLNSGGVNRKTPYIPLNEGVLNVMAALDRTLCRWAPGVFAMSQEVVFKRG